MTSLLVDRIGLLVTNDPWTGAGPLGILRNAAVLADDGRIAWIGPASEAPAADERLDADGRCVLPGFVDSHTHLVFAGDRAEEFAARMEGRPYTAGGITTTVEATRNATSEQLAVNLDRLIAEALRSGTTTVETKSGYGLTVPDEQRSLQVAAPRTQETTFLGAHVVPPEYEADAYVDLVKGEMLDACAPHARWIDVFCEQGAFDGDQTRAILEATPTNSATGRACNSRSSCTPPPRTTSPTSPTTTSTRSRTRAPSPPCSRARSSPPAPATPTRGA
jgi:imidazolonepropionase